MTSLDNEAIREKMRGFTQEIWDKIPPSMRTKYRTINKKHGYSLLNIESLHSSVDGIYNKKNNDKRRAKIKSSKVTLLNGTKSDSRSTSSRFTHSKRQIEYSSSESESEDEVSSRKSDYKTEQSSSDDEVPELRKESYNPDSEIIGYEEPIKTDDSFSDPEDLDPSIVSSVEFDNVDSESETESSSELNLTTEELNQGLTEADIQIETHVKASKTWQELVLKARKHPFVYPNREYTLNDWNRLSDFKKLVAICLYQDTENRIPISYQFECKNSLLEQLCYYRFFQYPLRIGVSYLIYLKDQNMNQEIFDIVDWRRVGSDGKQIKFLDRFGRSEVFGHILSESSTNLGDWLKLPDYIVVGMMSHLEQNPKRFTGKIEALCNGLHGRIICYGTEIPIRCYWDEFSPLIDMFVLLHKDPSNSDLLNWIGIDYNGPQEAYIENSIPEVDLSLDVNDLIKELDGISIESQ